MKEYFTEEQKNREINKIYIEEDDVLVIGEFVEGSGKTFILTGNAVIEGETYHEFEVEFELTEEPKEETAEEIMGIDWEWYDYLC